MNKRILESLAHRIVKECRSTDKSEAEIVDTILKAYDQHLLDRYGNIANGIKTKVRKKATASVGASTRSSKDPMGLFGSAETKSVDPLSKKMFFGKFKGKTFKWVRDNQPWYWNWMKDQGILKKNGL